MRLAEIWRYPVKSFAGERLTTVRVIERGLDGDRLWALVDTEGRIASGKTTGGFRKLPGLLRHRSHLEGDIPVITLADGRSARAGDPDISTVISAIAPEGWSLQREAGTSHFDAAALHLVTAATLASISRAIAEPMAAQRLRPNLVLDVGHTGSFPEDEWLGRKLRIGTATLLVSERCERCVMVGHPQAALAARPKLLKTIGAINHACAGVYAQVLVPGTVSQDDTVHLI